MDASVYQTIASGATVSITHHSMLCLFMLTKPELNIIILVASLYDFASAGTGTFSFTPITPSQFLGVGGNDVPSSLVPISTNEIHVNVTGDVSHRAHLEDKRSFVDPNCAQYAVEYGSIANRFVMSGTDQPGISTDPSRSYSEAKALAKLASDYIKSRGPNDALYVSYFKTNTPADVTAVLDNVANENDATRA